MKSVRIALLNLKERFFPSINQDDINLINQTQLFNGYNAEELEKIYKSARIIHYVKDQNVLREGDLADAFYIIKEGSVRVYTLDKDGKKIPLARLNKDDYFGEQALLKRGGTFKTRNASIETIEDSTLISIKSEAINTVWEKNHALQKKLDKIGYEQAIHKLTSVVQFYSQLENLIKEFSEDKQSIIEVPKDNVIFKYQDNPDNIYFIIDGSIRIVLPEKEGQNTKELLLNKGHLFGELGVVENTPRKATAIAASNSRLLVINGDHFREKYLADSKLKKLFGQLKQFYQLSTLGAVLQYMGQDENIGPAIISIYKMNDNRTITAIRSLIDDVFSISIANSPPEFTYEYKQGKYFTKLFVTKNKLTGIEVYGEWDELSDACQVLFNGTTIERSNLESFTSSRSLFPKKDLHKEIICVCMNVTINDIKKCIEEKINTIDEISKKTGASTVCGSCRPLILDMLGECPWLPATMKKTTEHNDYINSYIIQLKSGRFKLAAPGQHVVIQANINGFWIERPYTLTEYISDTKLRITIKKEEHGYFTEWLFAQAEQNIEVNVTQPQGYFVADFNKETPLICFAGGIGITPFLMFAQQNSELKHNKKIHIVYSARTNQDFIFIDEFKTIMDKHPNTSIIFHETKKAGRLSENDITQQVHSFTDPEIYICGPDGFQKMIASALAKIKFNQERIHIEAFVHAGDGKK